MSRKKWFISTSIGLILVAFVIYIFYNSLQPREEPRVYNLSLETTDLRIKDIEFVTYPDFVYITDHYLEAIDTDKKISGITYGISINGKSILSLSQADNPFTLPEAYQGKVYFETSNLMQGINVENDDKLNIQIIYEVDGERKDISKEIKVKDVLKPSQATTASNVIQM